MEYERLLMWVPTVKFIDEVCDRSHLTIDTHETVPVRLPLA